MSQHLDLYRTYRFRMEPTAEQQVRLAQFAGTRRFIWNWALARKQAYYHEHGRNLSLTELCRELTSLKQEPTTTWLTSIDSQLPQQALRDLEKAFQAFFARRVRYPRFKSRKRDRPSFRIPQRVVVKNTTVYVPKIGAIRIRQHQSLDGTIKSATFKCDASGHWYVTLIAHFTMPDVALPSPQPAMAVGVDLGLKDFAVLSTGEKIAAPRLYRRSERRMRRAQRQRSRKQRGSKNRQKAQRRLARIHTRVAQQRRDFLHKLSSRLVSEFDIICVEDLSVKGLGRTNLAKSVHDAGWGLFGHMLTYKAIWQRKRLVVIDRWFPSSKLCAACQSVVPTLALAERTWRCPTCHTEHDRDLNAACNLRNEGLRILAQGQGERLNG
jgi:putative transposase